MATTLVQSDLSLSPDFSRGAWLFTWGPLANGESGVASPGVASHADKSVQVTGTFGAAGSVQLEGSNDGTNWFILTDPPGVNLVFTAAGLKQVLQNTRFLRPTVTAGDGTTALTVRVVMMASTETP